MRVSAVCVLTALACLAAPMRRPRPLRWTPTEARPASKSLLDRMALGQMRTAMVLSLWQAHPGRQCVAAPHYAHASADFSPALTVAADTMGFAAPIGARALQERLRASGISAAEPGKAAELAQIFRLERRRAA